MASRINTFNSSPEDRALWLKDINNIVGPPSLSVHRDRIWIDHLEHISGSLDEGIYRACATQLCEGKLEWTTVDGRRALTQHLGAAFWKEPDNKIVQRRFPQTPLT